MATADLRQKFHFYNLYFAWADAHHNNENGSANSQHLNIRKSETSI